MNQNKRCNNCGELLNVNDNFCQKCGTRINNSQVNNQTQYENNQIPNNVNYNQGNNASNKSSNSWIFAVLGVVIVIALVGIYGYIYYNKDDEKSNSGNKVSNNSYQNNNNNNTLNTLTKNVAYNGYTFKVPYGYNYTEENNMIVFNDITGKWYVALNIKAGSYDSLEGNVDALMTSLKDKGLAVNNYKQQTIAGMKNIIIETNDTIDSSKNVLLGYVKANASTVYIISVYNVGNYYDYTQYNEFVWILSTAV